MRDRRFGAVLPPRIEDVLKANPDAKICLVDHQQTSQMNPAIRVEQIVGVIDHHALQSKTIVTDKPIYIDIRPWGSMSSIVAHSFLTNNRRPTKAVASFPASFFFLPSSVEGFLPFPFGTFL